MSKPIEIKWKQYELDENPFERLFMDKQKIENERKMFFHKEMMEYEFSIKHIYCNPKDKVTVVLFMDNSKEICRCAKDDEYSEYSGICICIAKHLYGKSKLDKIINAKKTVLYNDDNKKKGAK